jgi:hypothetical protein
LGKLEFGALLSYSPYGQTGQESLSRSYRTAVKNDEFVISSSKQIPMSEFIAQSVEQRMKNLPFAHLFKSNPVLVPTPSSSLRKADSLWVPQRIALALRNRGLGSEVAECPVRVSPLPKAATSAASNRPSAKQHYESLAVQKLLNEPESILLVDDVVTRGATLLGGANRIAEVYPKARMAAFAALRTVSNPRDFVRVYEPANGYITLLPSGGTLRRP